MQPAALMQIRKLKFILSRIFFRRADIPGVPGKHPYRRIFVQTHF